jgi:transcriptional regulator of acetoin/glycerol metabolism
VRPDDLPPSLKDSGQAAGVAIGPLSGNSSRVYPRQLSKAQVKAVIKKCKGNASEAAVELKIARSSLYRMLK